MKYLSQRNPLWASAKLGASSLTVGRYGCTTTCISMLTDAFGEIMWPDKIASRVDWYTKDGLILWNKLKLNISFIQRLRKRDDTAIIASLKNPKTAVMLEVDNGSHWIVAVRKLPFVNDYMCVDPWTGKMCTSLGDYKNITGSAHFMKI
jgi:hypothetical protein